MARKLIEYKVSDSDIVSYSNYNSTKTVLGPMMYKFTGSSVNDYYMGPPPLVWDNISQDTGIGYWGGPSIIKYNDTIDYIFMAYGMPGNVNPYRIVSYEFNKKNFQHRYLGTISCTTQATTQTAWSGPVATLDYYTAGTVSVNGLYVDGTNTNWGTNEINAGSRIGFGSTNPNDITNWYTINSVPLETSKFNGPTYSQEVDSLGRVYVGGGGTFTTYTHLGSAYTANGIIRLNPDGSPDLSFSTGAGFNGTVRRIKIDPTDPSKIYFAGDFSTYSGITGINKIIRLNVSDGSIDPTFSGGTNVNPANSRFSTGVVYDIDFDSNGKIYCVGINSGSAQNPMVYNGTNVSRICRLNYNGSLDTTFPSYVGNGLYYTTTPTSTNVFCVAVEPITNKVYVGGLFNQYSGITIGGTYQIIRLNTDATIDYTYTATTQFNNIPYSIVPDRFGSGIYVGGSFTTYSGLSNPYIIKLTNSGTKDNVFDNSTGGALAGGLVSKIKLTNDNKIYATGSFTSYRGLTNRYLIKLSPNGNPDTTLNLETNGSGTQWLNPQNSLTDNLAIDELNGYKIYTSQNSNATTFKGLIAYMSGGSINQEFYGLNLQKLSLTTSAPTYSAGTPYVIEDLRIYFGRPSSNSSMFGLYAIKGIKITDFVSGNTTINSSTNGYYGIQSKTCYWLPNGVNSGNYVIWSLVNDDKTDWGNQNCYVLSYNSLTIGVHNVRKLFRMTSDSTIVYPDNLLYSTSSGFDSSLQGLNNAIITTMSSGTANGIKSLYYVRQDAGIRQIPLSNIQSGINPFTFSDTQTMTEVPPGNTTTYPTSSGKLFQMTYVPEIDRLIITTNATNSKSYITSFNSQFVTPSLTNTLWSRDVYNNLSYQNSFERSFLVNGNQLQGTLSNTNVPKYPDTQGSSHQYIASNSGWLHYVRGTNSTENLIYSIPIACDEQYVDISNNVIITPKYVIPNLISITGFYLNTLKEIGSSVFSQSPEPIFVDFRTNGIDDNSGSWISFNSIDDLNGLLCNNTTNSITIQFRFRFRVAGINCNPNRLYGFSFTYEDDTTDSHYLPSVSKSSLTNRILSWQQVSTFGGTIPNMKVRIYNADSGDIILYDTITDSKLGTWEYSTNGTTWNSWSSSADAVGNYIRYTANYLPSNYKLRVGLNVV